MEIVFNGKKQYVSEIGISILDLIRKNNVQQPEMISVQQNGQFVKSEDLNRTRISEGDEIDFLYFMGGGE